MIAKVKDAYSKAHHMIWKMGYWRYLLLPILFSLLFALALLAGCAVFAFVASGWIEAYFRNRGDVHAWIRPLAAFLMFIIGLGPCYILFRNLVLFCYAPFLNRLSRKAEEWILGAALDENQNFFSALPRLLMMTLVTLSASVTVMIFGLALGWIPFVGWVVVMLLFPVQMLLSSLSYIDPYLERRGFGARASLKIMRKDLRGMFAFGCAGFCVTLVPVIGWFVGPTYSVVAGIVYGIHLAESEKTGPV